MGRSGNGTPRWLLVMVAGAIVTTGAIALINLLHENLMSPSARDRSLRLMTWNIGKIYLPLDSRAADKDLNHVARVIKEVNAHIVALQEMRDRKQLGRLLVQLGPRWRGQIPEDAYDRRAALLTRLPATFFELPTTSGRRAPGAEIRYPGLEQPLSVISVHLDAFDEKRRAQQTEELLSALRQRQPLQLFLAGDFNFDAASTSPSDRQVYRLLTKTLTDAGIDEGGTTVISKRLDYIFYRSSAVRQVHTRVLRERRINIMDHDPLLAELSIHSGGAAAK